MCPVCSISRWHTWSVQHHHPTFLPRSILRIVNHRKFMFWDSWNWNAQYQLALRQAHRLNHQRQFTFFHEYKFIEVLVLNSKRINKNRPGVNAVKNYEKYAKVVHLIYFQRAHVKVILEWFKWATLGCWKLLLLTVFPFHPHTQLWAVRRGHVTISIIEDYQQV